MFFKGDIHENLYFKMLASVDKNSQEYKIYCYVLSAIGKDAMLSYMDQDGIGIDDMLTDIDFSSGEKVLLRVAGNLFNRDQHCDLSELSRLDDDNLLVVIAAIKIKYLTTAI